MTTRDDPPVGRRVHAACHAAVRTIAHLAPRACVLPHIALCGAARPLANAPGIVLAAWAGMVPIVAAAFLAGLSGAPHCAGMCGPLLAAQARGVPATIGWHLGKALTYAALGAVAAGAASLVPRLVAWAPALGVLSWLALLWFSLRLAGARLPRVALGGERALLRLVGAVPRRASAWAPVALGALVGLLPCGLVYAALALALAAPSAPAAATAMAAFALGTLPATIAAGWGVRLLAWRSRPARLAMAAAVLVLGSLAIVHRATLGSAVADDPSVCHGD